MSKRAEREQPQRGGAERPKRERRDAPADAPGGGEERGDRSVPRRDPTAEREIRLPGRGPRQGERRPSGLEGAAERLGQREDEAIDVERELERVGTER